MNRRVSGAFVALWVLLAGMESGHAQSGGQAAAPLSEAEVTRFCNLAGENSDQFSYQELILAVQGCERAGRIDDATFFLLLSQIRFQVDSELLFPQTEADKTRKSQFFSYLYYRAGGSGPDHIYRDADRTERLFSRLLAWRAVMPADYDPGWKYKRLPDAAAVAEASERHAFNRVEKLRRYAALIADDEYYAASQALAAFRREHGNTYTAGTPVMEQYQALSRAARLAEKKLDLPEPQFRQPATIPVDPDADFRPVFIGHNGPKAAQSFIAASAADFADAFLAAAMTEAEIRQMTSDIDFSTEVAVVLAVGEKKGATGNLVVTDVVIEGQRPDYVLSRHSLMVGMIENSCRQPRHASYPFIVVAKKRPADALNSFSSGSSMGHFPDGCQEPVSGQPND